MAYEFRLLETGFNRAAFNMGLDEALLRAVAEGKSLPTLRFYGWDPPAVSLGYFQGLHEEVDTTECEISGIDVVRRITGGGAVFHHHEVTYSMVLPLSHPLARPNILDSYRLLLSGITEGLSILGIKAEFAPINDIVTGGKKISGNAQTRKLGCILQHGTILIDLDLDRMFSVLKVPQEKAKGKLIEGIKSRVTCIKYCLPQSESKSFISFYTTTIQSLKEGFSKALNLTFADSVPSVPELQLAEQLAQEKFSSPAWLTMR